MFYMALLLKLNIRNLRIFDFAKNSRIKGDYEMNMGSIYKYLEKEQETVSICSRNDRSSDR